MKPRIQSEKLTPADIAKLRAAFDAGCHPADAAADVNCTRRIVNKYYQRFRGYPLPRGRRTTLSRRPRQPIPQAESEPKPPRFYTSTFEL